jgi:hypothetical protein
VEEEPVVLPEELEDLVEVVVKALLVVTVQLRKVLVEEVVRADWEIPVEAEAEELVKRVLPA